MKPENFETIRREGFNRIFSSRRRIFSLKMTPMIDLIFLLLIFFLVTAKWRPKENFLPFQLPAAQAQLQRLGKPEPLIIHIVATQNGCQVQINKLDTISVTNENFEADLVLLMEEIKKTMTSQKRFTCDPIEIICEPAVKWDYAAKIYNLFIGAGLTDITFQMTGEMENKK